MNQAIWQSANARRFFLSVLIVFIAVLGCWQKADQQAHELVNQALVSAAASYTVARTLDAAISTLQSSEVSAGVVSVDIGQMLNPISDLINKFSDIMVMAFTSLSLQKVLLMILSSTGINVVFTIFSLGMLAVIWIKPLGRYRKRGWAIFQFVVIGRFIVVLSVLSTSLVDHLFLEQQIEANQNKVVMVSDEPGVQSTMKVAPEQTKSDHSFLGFIQQLQDQWSQWTDNLQQQKAHLTELSDRIENSVVDILTLMALYLLKTLILPIIFLLLCRYWIARLFSILMGSHSLGRE
ncbi:hypothetical protein F9817_21650 [Vibrio sp. CAIM 722]|uniref:Uncharacterized protein n=1 Tax=Vibrio eleionomae TaxID=2653505 RepID=A0A7X4LPJ1_9VIBR|nr:hypothetical protein [Vibrio eleionomae]MZI95793.1 hypothetical protein [Vibrio eleionomae]